MLIKLHKIHRTKLFSCSLRLLLETQNEKKKKKQKKKKKKKKQKKKNLACKVARSFKVFPLGFAKQIMKLIIKNKMFDVFCAGDRTQHTSNGFLGNVLLFDYENKK